MRISASRPSGLVPYRTLQIQSALSYALMQKTDHFVDVDAPVVRFLTGFTCRILRVKLSLPHTAVQSLFQSNECYY